MGVGASMPRLRDTERCIFVESKPGTAERVLFTERTSLHTFESLIKSAAGFKLGNPNQMLLQGQDGHLMTLDYAAKHATNEVSKPFRVQVVTDTQEQTKLADGIGELRKEMHELKEIVNQLKSNTNHVKRKRDVSQYKEISHEPAVKEDLKTPTFNIWNYNNDELLSLLEFMFYDLEVVEEFNIPPMTLRRWLMCVQENYRETPFHNFKHCFYVSQMFYSVAHLCHLRDQISRREIATLLVACVCHDLDHPGLTNAYHVNSRTELAIRYNDISPLENHHAALTFRILGSPDLNIFLNLSTEEFKKTRRLIIQLILATDMARHSELVSSFRLKLPDFDVNNEDHRLILMQMVIKLCDVSNEARPTRVSEPWLDMLLEEYFAQGDRERREGLPVEPFMDRSLMTKPKAQIGFIRFVLIPLYELVGTVLQQVTEKLVPSLRNALAHYEVMQTNEQAAAAGSKVALEYTNFQRRASRMSRSNRVEADAETA